MFRSGTFKLGWWFFNRPMLPFALQFVLLAPLILSGDPGQTAPVYIFALPWLLLCLGILNLPFIGAAFRAFRIDAATKRNHALEHATVFHLEKSSRRRFSGRAERNGFQISGHASAREIRTAFERVRLAVRDGEQLTYVSRRCGSNVVTASGLGLASLLLVFLLSAIVRPSLGVRAGALVAVVLMFAGLRHGIGNAIQRRFFTAVDFAEVSLRDIRRVPTHPPDRAPTHFVETIVRDGRRNVALADREQPCGDRWVARHLRCCRSQDASDR